MKSIPRWLSPEHVGPVSFLLQAVGDIRFVIKDLEHRYIFVNDNWLASNGFDHADAVKGKTAADIFPSWRSERYLREERRVMSEQIIYDYEEFLLNSDGDLERWRTMKAPWFEGEVVKGYVNVGTRLESRELEQRADHIPETVQTIARKACEPSSISELADSLSISRRTLERKFRDAMNMSPQEFRTRCRVLRAKKILREGTSPSEVATHCGFADQSHFSKTFKKHIGLSPKQYQMQHRNMAHKNTKSHPF